MDPSTRLISRFLTSACRARVRRSTDPTGWIRSHYDRGAAAYDKRLSFFERTLFAGGREWVCSKATGDVLEIGVGTGLNLPYYPRNVNLVGIDLSSEMLGLARRRADGLGRTIELHVADAQALPFPDSSFDTIVSTLSLCTIPDDRAAAAEARRLLRPGGRFLLLEHVRSPLPLARFGQRLAELLTLRFDGDHQLREPLDRLRAEGFAIDALERSKWGIVERVAARKLD